jgi:dihydrofolate synthase/folylpolyglutamate synthase
MRDRQWRSERIGRGFVVSDRHGKFYANPPALTGAHQADNAALAVAMLRAQPLLDVPETALQRGLASARWPARMQALGSGPLTRQMPGRTIWLDGGHNADAAEALAQALKTGPMMDMVLGMLANKDLRGFLTPIADKISTLSTVCVKGHAAHDGSTFAEVAAELGLKHRHFEHFDDAFVANATQNDRDLLVCGSLYLAGEVLRLNEELPA